MPPLTVMIEPVSPACNMRCRSGCRRDRVPAMGDRARLNKRPGSYQALLAYAYPRMEAMAISASGRR